MRPVLFLIAITGSLLLAGGCERDEVDPAGEGRMFQPREETHGVEERGGAVQQLPEGVRSRGIQPEPLEPAIPREQQPHLDDE